MKRKVVNRILAAVCAGAMAIVMIGCGGTEEKENSRESSVSSESTSSQESIGESSMESSTGESSAAGEAEELSGWSEEMESIKAAVTTALGENYWPDTAVQPDVLETLFGITAEMYEDYLAEMPMISTNVDTLVIVKPKQGQAEAVEAALTAYRESKVNSTMQYPMNIGKIQASRVERIGDYVCFVQLGADTMEAAEESDEAVIAMCQEANELVIGIITEKVQQ